MWAGDWYTIYHPLPVVNNQPPLFSSTNGNLGHLWSSKHGYNLLLNRGMNQQVDKPSFGQTHFRSVTPWCDLDYDTPFAPNISVLQPFLGGFHTDHKEGGPMNGWFTVVIENIIFYLC